MRKLKLLAAFLALGVGAAVHADDDDDATALIPGLPVVKVSASDPVAFRGLSTGAFTLRREGTNGDLTVSLALSGSASNGVDYVKLPDSVTIPAGFHAVGLQVSPLGSGVASPNEWVTLTIVTNTNYNVGKPRSASVLIKGNEFENQAPTVAITSPADNSSVLSHTDLTISANATDANDTVKKVSFYANDKLIGTDASAPYSVVWSNVPAGSFALFARAEDEFGKSTLSSAIHLSVTNPPPTGVTVALVSPAANSAFKAPANIPLEAKVNEAGKVQSVGFFAGDHLIGSVSAAPFTLTWSNVPPGTYSLRAKATDTNGAVVSSARVSIFVTNAPTKLTIIAPTNNTVLAGPANVSIEATADAPVSGITFYGDSKVLGTVKTAPYSLTWSNVPPGRHLIIAKTDDAFGFFSSAAVQITVTNPPPTVKLTSPADGATVTAPATIELNADAADADGIMYVSFYAGDRLLGIDKTAPYSLTLSNVGPGSYTFTAHARDIYEQRTISTPVKVTVAKVP